MEIKIFCSKKYMNISLVCKCTMLIIIEENISTYYVKLFLCAIDCEFYFKLTPISTWRRRASRRRLAMVHASAAASTTSNRAAASNPNKSSESLPAEPCNPPCQRPSYKHITKLKSFLQQIAEHNNILSTFLLVKSRVYNWDLKYIYIQGVP